MAVPVERCGWSHQQRLKKNEIKYTRILKGPPVVPQTLSTEHTLFTSILKVSYLELIPVARQPGFTPNNVSGALCVCACWECDAALIKGGVVSWVCTSLYLFLLR